MTPFFLFNIEPVISYDEFIGDVVLFENYLIRIFMNIHKTVKKWEKTREKTYPLQGIGKVIRCNLSCIPGINSQDCQYFSEGHINVIKCCPQQRKNHLHDVELHSFHATPHAILKNRMYLQKYLHPTTE